MAALLGHHTTLQDLQYTKLIAHTPQQYPRRQCAAVTRWENINWIIICTSNSPSHWHTPSRHHQPQLPSLTCTTSNPPILFNTSTARGSCNWRWEINFINRFCMMLWTHLDIFWNSRCFVAPSTTPPTPTTNPNWPLSAQIYIIGKRMRRWQGKKLFERHFVLLYFHHLLFVLTST